MRTRTFAAGLALALALAVPSSALAGSVSQTSTVTEGLIASNIAMVVPATATYTQVAGSPGFYQYSMAVTGVSTDSPAGLTVKARVSTLTGPATIPTTDRQLALTTALSAGLATVSAGATAYGSFVDNTTQITFVTSTGPVAAGGFTMWPTVRNISTSGTYSSTLTLIATSN